MSATAYQLYKELVPRRPNDPEKGLAFDISKTVQRLRQGRSSLVDYEIVMACLQSILHRVNSFATRHEPLANQTVVMPNGKRLQVLDRQYAVKWTEVYFATDFKFKSSLDEVKVVFNALTVLDPVPPRAGPLRAAILTRAEALLTPVRQRLRPRTATNPAAFAPSAGPIAPAPQIEVRDAFAPPRQSTKRRALAPAAKTAAPVALVWSPPVIAPDRDLRAFTRYVDTPRDLDRLSDQSVYEFWYLRERRPRTRRARVSAEVVDWMRANPVAARQMLSALHLGRSQDLPGIKRLLATSSRYAGPLFEIKSHGSFRVLMIEVDDCWQLLKISHKDAQDRDAQWLEPLD
jgi:hypothetical protein